MTGRNNVGGLIGDAVVGDVVQGKTFSSLAAGINKTGTFPSIAEGNSQIYQGVGANTPNSLNHSEYTKVADIEVTYSGTYRTVFRIGVASTSRTAYGRIYKNGTAFGIERSNQELVGVEYTEDLEFSAGDNIQLYIKLDTTAFSLRYYYFRVFIETNPLLTVVT